MNSNRLVIGDAVRERVAPHLPGKVSDRGVTARNNRLLVEAVLWRLRTGSPQRDPLASFGKLPGQCHDLVGVRPLIEDIHLDALLGGKVFDADWPRKELDDHGALAVIAPRRHRERRIDDDARLYRWCHPIENDFAGIKEFRAIATRCDKIPAIGQIPISSRSSPPRNKCQQTRVSVSGSLHVPGQR